MSAVIRNKFGDGILCGSPAEAEAKLGKMLRDFRAKGLLVSEDKEDGKPLYRVSEEDGRPVGIFYIDDAG